MPTRRAPILWAVVRWAWGASRGLPTAHRSHGRQLVPPDLPPPPLAPPEPGEVINAGAVVGNEGLPGAGGGAGPAMMVAARHILHTILTHLNSSAASPVSPTFITCREAAAPSSRVLLLLLEG